MTLSKTGQTLPGRKSAPKNISSRLAFDSSGYKNENDVMLYPKQNISCTMIGLSPSILVMMTL